MNRILENLNRCFMATKKKPIPTNKALYAS